MAAFGEKSTVRGDINITWQTGDFRVHRRMYAWYSTTAKCISAGASHGHEPTSFPICQLRLRPPPKESGGVEANHSCVAICGEIPRVFEIGSIYARSVLDVTSDVS